MNAPVCQPALTEHWFNVYASALGHQWRGKPFQFRSSCERAAAEIAGPGSASRAAYRIHVLPKAKPEPAPQEAKPVTVVLKADTAPLAKAIERASLAVANLASAQNLARAASAEVAKVHREGAARTHREIARAEAQVAKLTPPGEPKDTREKLIEHMAQPAPSAPEASTPRPEKPAAVVRAPGAAPQPARVLPAPVAPPAAAVLPPPVAAPHPAVVTATRKMPQTQKDKVLDAYAATGDANGVLAQRLDVVRNSVAAIISVGRADRDPRVATGDRKRAARLMPNDKPVQVAAPPALIETVKPGSQTIPAGRVLVVNKATGEVVGPRGTWGAGSLILKVLDQMGDGQMYGSPLLHKNGFLKTAKMEDMAQSWAPKLALVGVKVVVSRGVGARLERMGG